MKNIKKKIVKILNKKNIKEPERFSYHLNLVHVFLRFFSHVLLYIHGKMDLKKNWGYNKYKKGKACLNISYKGALDLFSRIG